MSSTDRQDGMNTRDDPFEMWATEGKIDEFAALILKPVRPDLPTAALPHATTARFRGFDLDDRPLVAGLADRPHEIVAARTTVPLTRSHIGFSVVLLFENGDTQKPIIVGVLQEPRRVGEAECDDAQVVTVDVDDHRLVLSAEREILLRCGDASITLTRAGKVIIKGTYIVSRSSGYNKIKGAAVDIN